MNKLFFTIFIVCLILPAGVFATGPIDSTTAEELKNGINGLKKDLSELKNEIKGLKKLIETRLQEKPPAQPCKIRGKAKINGDPFMGSPDAPLVIVEFSDFECPFCGRFFRNTLPRIKKDYIDSGKLKYVFKDFPLAFHKKAPKAAEASHCAGEENKYWEMHDLIFENQRQMDLPYLISYAEKLGLNVQNFEKCLEESRYAEGIKKDIAAGKSNGVTGTPSFILGIQNKQGEVEGKTIRGAQPYATFKTAIDSMLKEVKTGG